MVFHIGIYLSKFVTCNIIKMFFPISIKIISIHDLKSSLKSRYKLLIVKISQIEILML